MGTHNVHRAAELLRGRRAAGPDHRDLRRRRHRRPRPVPVGAAGGPRDVLQRVGDDPDRLRQQLRVLHRAGRARRGDLPPVRRDRRRGRRARRRRASPRSRCSARTSTATAATSSWRPAATATPTARVRPLFADLLRAAGAVDGIRRVRFTSPHPKDMRPETFAAMAETPAVCPQLHYPLQAGSDRVLAAMHRGYTAERYLERLAEARRVVPDLAVSTDIIVGFPGETDDDFERTLEVAAEARFDDAFTFIFSPRPGTEAAAMTDRFVDPAVAGERFDRLRVVIERSALAANQARVGRVEEVLVEGPSKKDPAVARRPHRRSTGSCTSRRRARCAPAPTPAVEITGAAPHHLTGRLRRARRRAGAQAAHPRRRALTVPRPGRRARPDGVGQVGRGDGRGAGRRRHRDRRRRRHAGVPRHGHRHGQADAPPTGRPCATTASTSSTRPTTSRSPTTGAAYDAAVADDRRAGRCSSPAPGSTSPRSSTASTCPAGGPTVRAELEAEPDLAALWRRLAELDPVAAGAHRARQPPPHRAGPRGRARQRAAVQLVRPGPAGLPADATRC